MTGFFEIRPQGKSTITCSTIDNISASDIYVLVAADLRESAREKVVYSEGDIDGSAIWSETGIEDIILDILVGGNTSEDVANNVAALQSAMSNTAGGYIVYRPPGYADSIIKTWYRYFLSSPPSRLNEQYTYQAPGRNYILGSLFRFVIKIRSLATSDPTTLQSILTATDISNFSVVNIPNSSIKGAGIIPVIRLTNTDIASQIINEFVIHVTPTNSSALGKDYIQNPLADSWTFDATNRYRFQTLSSGSLEYNIPEDSDILFGRCTPLLPVKIITGLGQWEARVKYVNEVVTDWHELVGDTSQFRMNVLENIPFPITRLPVTRTMSNTGFDAYTLTVEFRTRDGNNYSMDVYGLFLPKVEKDSWIAMFGDQVVPRRGTIVGGGTFQAIIDSVDGSNYGINTAATPDTISVGMSKRGMPIKSLIMRKGTDYQIRCLFHDYTQSGYHHDAATMDIEVEGVFYTIYPFGES